MPRFALRSPLYALACAAPLAACGASNDAAAPHDAGAKAEAGPFPLDAAIPLDDASYPADYVGLAMWKLYFGDTDWNDAPSVSAWKQLGLDIDGKSTTRASTDVCTRAPGASAMVQEDGEAGIDNSFGANVLPIFITTEGSDLGSKIGKAMQAGAFTTLFRIDGLGPASSYPALSAALYAGGATAQPPAWDGRDAWPVLSTSVSGGRIDSPVIAFPKSVLASRVWSSGDALPVATLSLPLFLPVPVTVPIHHLRFTMTISDDGRSSTRGVLSGVIPTEALVAAFQQVAGRISTSLCGSAALDSLVQQIRQASDILQDGTNAPGKACDGISIGLGFETKAVRLGAIVDPPAPFDPCGATDAGAD